jgi:hypothetical protein
MKIEKIAPTPEALMDFAAEALPRLGALCERTWHDRLQVVAEGAASEALGCGGDLGEKELRFPGGLAEDAERDVFPGGPLTFRIVEALWRAEQRPLRAALAGGGEKAPETDTLVRAWERREPAARRLSLGQPVKAAWHFSIAAVVRCEVQAIDQHWSLHQIAIGWPGGEPDEGLAQEIAFLGDDPPPAEIAWPAAESGEIAARIDRALRAQIDLGAIRRRQEHYLKRELARLDAYFLGYRQELEARRARSRKQAPEKFAQRLRAAEEEHRRRRDDQVHRHEICVRPHLDALLWIAEPAWRTRLRWERDRQLHDAEWDYVPRLRRWMAAAAM